MQISSSNDNVHQLLFIGFYSLSTTNKKKTGKESSSSFKYFFLSGLILHCIE